MTSSSNPKIVFIVDGCIFRDQKEYEERISLMELPIVFYKGIELSIPLMDCQKVSFGFKYFLTIFQLHNFSSWDDLMRCISFNKLCPRDDLTRYSIFG